MSEKAVERQTILIAEDEEINRTILREMLQDKYRILEAENGHQAVFHIKAEEKNLALIILDIHMPRLDGFGVMDYLVDNGLNEKIPVIITTADQSSEVLLQGKKNKVADIVYKPFRVSDIRKRVDNLVEICRYEQDLDSIIEDKSKYLAKQYEALQSVKKGKKDKWEDTLKSIYSKMLPESMEHNERIRSYTDLICEYITRIYPKYGMTKSIQKSISEATMLHDIGKVVIADSVFEQKEGASHRALMQIRKQPVAGSEMIDMIFATQNRDDKKYYYDICRHMHEQYDGKGYPEGLVGDEIPLSAQIVGLVHRYDELRFAQKDNIPTETHKTVMRKILEAEYRRYNPDLLEAFEELSEDIERESERVR